MQINSAATLHVFEKYQQIIHRHAPSFIRHVLEGFRSRSLNATQASDQLGLCPSRLYALATAYNTARTRKQQPLWTPGASGGDHASAWPLRLHAFKLDRAQVRRWALQNNLAHAVPPKKVRADCRRQSPYQ